MGTENPEKYDYTFQGYLTLRDMFTMAMEENTPELDNETINDFLDEYLDAYQTIENILIEIESSPDSIKQHIDNLFRSIHSIKGNLSMVALDDLSHIIHILENTLDDIRNNKLEYISDLNELILLVVAQVRELANQQFQDEDITQAMTLLNNALSDLNQTQNTQLKQTIARILSKIDPDGDYPQSPLSTTEAIASQSENDSDMVFFIELSEQIESFFPHWVGRNQRILDICLTMNQLANTPVNIKQLTAAVYLHDIGMSFIPYEILIKPLPLNCDDELILREHCHLGYQWIKRIPHWQEAGHMIFQHHERMDGSGYPLGLKQKQISEGAKIIAIADTFEALTHERNHRKEVKTPMQAIMEINSNSGTQFDERWVECFNQTIKNKTT